MSDSNDKKPAAPFQGWPNPEKQAAPTQDTGPVLEDPLAELDRIVNQDFGISSDKQAVETSVSNDDLLNLEQELISELRGQRDPASPTGAADLDQFAADFAQAQPSQDPLSRPHPLAPSYSAPAVPEAPAVPPVAPDVSITPEAPSYANPVEPAPVSRVEPVMSAPPIATMPTSDGGAEASAPVEAPSLDDWSNIFDTAATKAPEPEVQAPVESAPMAAAAPAPSIDDQVSMSGSYGQLNRPSAQDVSAVPPSVPVYAETPVEPAAPAIHAYNEPSAPAYEPYVAPSELTTPAAAAPSAEPMSSYRPGQSYTDEPVAEPAPGPADTWSNPASYQEPQVEAPQAYQPVSAPEPAPAAPVAPASYVPQPSVYNEPPQAAPAVDSYHQMRGSQDPIVEPYGHQGVPEVAAPVTTDHATDPYAAFNQAQTVPYAGYNDGNAPQAAGMGVAPSVDVSGHDASYQADSVGYQGGANYSDPVAHGTHQGGYDQQYVGAGYEADNGALSSDYPAASGPHGSYADPSVAQAAEESAPYLQDEDYTTADTAAAMAAEPSGGKSRKGLIAGLAAVGVVAVGGLIAWGYGSGGDSGQTETPVITAENGPVKEKPKNPGGKVIPHQNKTVYDRIDGTENDEGPSTMMPATEKPIAVGQDGNAPRVIPLSGGQSDVAQNNGAIAGQANNGSIAPKPVRTVVVRPDGTIVTGAEATQPKIDPVDQQMLNATPSEQAMVQTLNNGVNGAIDPAAPVAEAAPAASGTQLLPREKPAELVALQAAAKSAAAAQPAPAAPAPAAVAPQAQPLVLAPQNSQPAATTNSGAGGYTVQVTSQRTPDQARASYNSIQAQLSGVLGGYQPDIKKADLGARGTYYRVRVGSFADRGRANTFCSQIKAAGGDCLVARK